MKIKLQIILISFFSLTMISCSQDETEIVTEPIGAGINSVVDVVDPVTDIVGDVVDDTGDVIDDVVDDVVDVVVDGDNNCSNIIAAPSLTANGSAGQVTLDWNALECATSYTLYWNTSTGISASSTAITSIGVNNYTHSNLDNGSIYYYKVSAIDAANTSSALSSEVSAATPLPAPDNLSISGSSDTIILTWNSVSGATGYTLYWDNVSGIDSSDTAITSITNDNYTHSSLSDGTYYYKVAAVNSTGTGTLSSVGSSILASNIDGAETFSEHTYAITTTAMSFSAAQSAAAAVGGYLVTVNTKAENTFLTEEFYSAYGNRALWIGANDIDTENTWVWDNGTTSGDNGTTDNICDTGCTPRSNAKWPDGTFKWNNNGTNATEPNNSGGEDCANITNSNGFWNDLSCTNNQYGIIEIE
jgi:fibronectin type 3 domain-containing protein